MDFVTCSAIGFVLGKHLEMHRMFQTSAIPSLFSSALDSISSPGGGSLILSLLSWHMHSSGSPVSTRDSIGFSSSWIPPQYAALLDVVLRCDDSLVVAQILVRLASLKG